MASFFRNSPLFCRIEHYGGRGHYGWNAWNAMCQVMISHALKQGKTLLVGVYKIVSAQSLGPSPLHAYNFTRNFARNSDLNKYPCQ